MFKLLLQATTMLSLLLYKMNTSTDPQIKMAVLHGLPLMVTHKVGNNIAYTVSVAARY